RAAGEITELLPQIAFDHSPLSKHRTDCTPVALAGSVGAALVRSRPPSRASPEPPVGFEPTTARLRIECSTPELRWRGASGAEGSRTPDLCSAIAALSQLSYGPAGQRGERYP